MIQQQNKAKPWAYMLGYTCTLQQTSSHYHNYTEVHVHESTERMECLYIPLSVCQDEVFSLHYIFRQYVIVCYLSIHFSSDEDDYVYISSYYHH